MLKAKLSKTAHDGCEDLRSVIWSWRRRWGEGSQNTALYDSADWACGQGKLTFDGRRSSCEARIPKCCQGLPASFEVARPQPRSPAPRADPEGQFVYK